MRQGFSLVEIIIVVAIAASIVIVVSNLSGNISLLNGLVSQELQTKSDINQTLQIMTTQIRSACTSANGAYPIVSAATSSFIFYSNGDDNGVLQRVRYFLSSSTIWRGTIQPAGTPATYPTATEIVTDMVDNVIIPSSTALFSYYSAAYTGTQAAMTSTLDVSPIRMVLMSFTADVNPKQSPGVQYFSIASDIRNLRSN
jgi:prepilin-type N-terminal cleavage/methylation domain-containing protein